MNLNVVIVSAFCFFYPTYNEVLNANDRRNSVVYKNSFCLRRCLLSLSRVLCELSVSPHDDSRAIFCVRLSITIKDTVHFYVEGTQERDRKKKRPTDLK